MQSIPEALFLASTAQLTEEEALAVFEASARDLLRLSGAGFLAKLKRGEFSPLENHPGAMRVAELIPSALGTSRTAGLAPRGALLRKAYVSR